MSPSASELIALDGGWAPFPGWSIVEIGGADRERFLASQVTSDVTGLARGAVQLSALLNRSGRLQAFFFLHKRPEVIDLLVPDAARDRCISSLTDHVIADDVSIRHVPTAAMRLLLGPKALVETAVGFPVTGWGSRGLVVWDGEPTDDLARIADDELEALRVLGGPPSWGDDVVADQLINETALLDTAVSFDKGCYLGQETVAKLASGRGAARGPALFEADPNGVGADLFVGRSFSVGDRMRAGDVRSAAVYDGTLWLWLSLRRELRVSGKRLRLTFSPDTSIDGTVRQWPALPPPTEEGMAAELTVAASGCFACDRIDRAVELLERAIAISSGSADAYESLGVIFGRIGRVREAIGLMERLLEVDPGSVMAHTNLSLFHNQLGDRDRAEHHLAAAARASFAGADSPSEGGPSSPTGADAEDRRRRESMFRRVLEIDPDDPLAHFGLGELAVEEGRLDVAVDHLERAIAADPGHSAAILALGAALEGLGETDRARETYRSGIESAAKRGELATAQKMQQRFNAINELPR